ncbi:MAG: hypothetical protein NZ899_06365 [Thermoguttaceae bacterium]|nr:hypothetical protein [Thermoguttaceae bacterium]MDW8079216.1 hypothetical protein [Thermoguttaceae bacterium]
MSDAWGSSESLRDRRSAVPGGLAEAPAARTPSWRPWAATLWIVPLSLIGICAIQLATEVFRGLSAQVLSAVVLLGVIVGSALAGWLPWQLGISVWRLEKAVEISSMGKPPGHRQPGLNPPVSLVSFCQDLFGLLRAWRMPSGEAIAFTAKAVINRASLANLVYFWVPLWGYGAVVALERLGTYHRLSLDELDVTIFAWQAWIPLLVVFVATLSLIAFELWWRIALLRWIRAEHEKLVLDLIPKVEPVPETLKAEPPSIHKEIPPAVVHSAEETSKTAPPVGRPGQPWEASPETEEPPLEF